MRYPDGGTRRLAFWCTRCVSQKDPWGFTMGDNGGQWGTMAQHIRVRNACLIGTLYLKGEILASLHHMEAMLHDRCHKRAIDLV
jgi:hypothetical protein